MKASTQRFVWSPRAVAGLLAAKLIVLQAQMPDDRIVIETCEAEGAYPLLAVMGSRGAFRRAENEAYKAWGPEAGDLFARRLASGDVTAVAGASGIVIPVIPLVPSATRTSELPPTFDYFNWQILP